MMTVGEMFASAREVLAGRMWSSVLDIGCGDKPQTLLSAFRHVCVDPFAPFLDRLPPRYESYCLDWRAALSRFQDREFEAIVLLDVIEHLDKEQGQELLAATLLKLPRLVVVFTPHGFCPQGPAREEEGGNLLSHKSGWVPSDLGAGWWILEGIHEQGVEPGVRDAPVPCFMAMHWRL